MKNDPEPNSNELANMDPMELLKRYAKFEHFQILGECLGQNLRSLPTEPNTHSKIGLIARPPTV